MYAFTTITPYTGIFKIFNYYVKNIDNTKVSASATYDFSGIAGQNVKI
jgi:hypothetical protein